MKRPLSDAIALARQDFGTDASRRVDWERVDQSLFTRIELERKKDDRAHLANPQGRRWAYLGAAAMAVAATLGILTGEGPDASPLHSSAAHLETLAGRITELGGQGSVLVNGVGAAPATPVRLGDSLETHAAEATIVREGAATLVIEANSRLSVRQVSGTLILALERGAIQARVTPVATGEAFAVDVADERIAVHGTVLRVARVGDRTAVDLAEGVVSVGAAPRFGPLLGSLVTAPAHVEFSVADAARTLKVSHDPTQVRSVPLSIGSTATAAPRFEEPERSLRTKSEPNPLRPTPPTATPAGPPGRADGHAPASSSPAGMSGDAAPNESVEAAVLACMRERPRAENVTVVVNTTLYLEVGDDGTVRAARFDPPVMPDVNGCAAAAIYKTHFPRSGAVAIPIEFKN